MDNEIVQEEKNVNSRMRLKFLDACWGLWTIASSE